MSQHELLFFYLDSNASWKWKVFVKYLKYFPMYLYLNTFVFKSTCIWIPQEYLYLNAFQCIWPHVWYPPIITPTHPPMTTSTRLHPPIHIWPDPPIHTWLCPPIHTWLCPPIHTWLCPPIHPPPTQSGINSPMATDRLYSFSASSNFCMS